MSEPRLYAIVYKASLPGAAWLAHMWDGDTDHYAAFTSQLHAETWLYQQDDGDTLPERERTHHNQYYYEWADSK